VHPLAALAMQRQGTPEWVTTCLFYTLQEAEHQVRMAFGDFNTHFGGQDIIPMHGMCQGNGAGPPIWVVVSTRILDMLRAVELGSFVCMAITKKQIRFSGFSFIDDTDTIQMTRTSLETWRDVVRNLK
jgi:hypothetical protein